MFLVLVIFCVVVWFGFLLIFFLVMVNFLIVFNEWVNLGLMILIVFKEGLMLFVVVFLIWKKMGLKCKLMIWELSMDCVMNLFSILKRWRICFLLGVVVFLLFSGWGKRLFWVLINLFELVEFILCYNLSFFLENFLDMVE